MFDAFIDEASDGEDKNVDQVNDQSSPSSLEPNGQRQSATTAIRDHAHQAQSKRTSFPFNNPHLSAKPSSACSLASSIEQSYNIFEQLPFINNTSSINDPPLINHSGSVFSCKGLRKMPIALVVLPAMHAATRHAVRTLIAYSSLCHTPV